MDFEGALAARLTGAPAVAALAGDRVSWVDRPEADGLPAVTLQIIDDPRPQHLKGFQELRPTRVQIDVWGPTYAAKKALAEAVIAAVVPEHAGNGIRFDRGVVDGARDHGEKKGTIFVHRTTIDLIAWWTTEG